MHGCVCLCLYECPWWWNTRIVPASQHRPSLPDGLRQAPRRAPHIRGRDLARGEPDQAMRREGEEPVQEEGDLETMHD